MTITTQTDTQKLMLWAATVRNKSFAERIKAAQAGGFTTMSMFPLDYQMFTERGTSAADMHAMMDESGVKVTVLDPFTKWTPSWEPPAGLGKDDLAFLDIDEAEFFRMGEALGVESMSVIEPFHNEFPQDALVESFAAICDKAAQNGWRVHLEFMPTSSIDSLATAWDIVKKADKSNGGLVFDLWHYFRGEPDDDLLRTIPGERIYRVQVADAKDEIQGGSLNEDLLHYRLLPGAGDFALKPTLEILNEIGGFSSVGIELFSDEFDAMSAPEAGEKAGRSLRNVLVD